MASCSLFAADSKYVNISVLFQCVNFPKYLILLFLKGKTLFLDEQGALIAAATFALMMRHLVEVAPAQQLLVSGHSSIYVAEFHFLSESFR